MDCVNHGGVAASAFCQNCGKPLCPNCVRTGAAGQILCDPCLQAWQTVPNPFVAPPSGAPNPWVAAGIGVIPGVGAMYNGQFFKGFIHVIVFALLVSGASSAHGGLDVFFGLMIPAWVMYQAFEAYHVALARRDGQPIPDPLGLNEIGNWLNIGQRNRPPAGQPGAPGFAPNFTPGAVPPNPGQAPYQAPYQADPQAGYQAPPQPGFQGVPYTPYADPNMPPPPPPAFWHRREPIGAVILIALGLLFLLNEVSGLVWKFAWPVFLIGLGVWLMVRRMGETKGGPQ